MFNRNKFLFAVPLAFISVVAPAFASTTLPTGTKFTSSSTCQAASSISGIPSSSLRLVNNIKYDAREINKGYNDSTHVRVLVNGQLQWVTIAGCGSLPVFQSTNTCRVSSSISGIPSSPYRLTNGRYYAITAFNQQSNPASSTHVQLNNDGYLEWTAINGCGNVINVGGTSTPTPSPTPSPTPTPSGGVPGTGTFFDTTNNTENNKTGAADPTPPVPTFTAFDIEMAAICGEPGSRVSPTVFKNTLKKYPAELSRIMQYTGYRVFGSRPAQYTNVDQYLDQLAEAWVNTDTYAYDHIFCGEPEPTKIGGLHFHRRYFDLQQKGQAGRLLNNSSNQEVVPGSIYTIGVKMQRGATPSSGYSQSSIKGYGYTLSAEDMLKIATKAFRDNPTSSTSSEACIIRNFLDDGKLLNLVFVRRASGIRTFYPDATPSSSDPTCKVNP